MQTDLEKLLSLLSVLPHALDRYTQTCRRVHPHLTNSAKMTTSTEHALLTTNPFAIIFDM
jgi:hypothetical protein